MPSQDATRLDQLARMESDGPRQSVRHACVNLVEILVDGSLRYDEETANHAHVVAVRREVAGLVEKELRHGSQEQSCFAARRRLDKGQPLP